jgi:hypothetical protein
MLCPNPNRDLPSLRQRKQPAIDAEWKRLEAEHVLEETPEIRHFHAIAQLIFVANVIRLLRKR